MLKEYLLGLKYINLFIKKSFTFLKNIKFLNWDIIIDIKIKQ